MLGAIAQFETEIRAERQMDGIQHAKAQGIPFGRRKALPRPRITELQARRQGTPIGTLMRDYRISRATIYRYLNEVGADQPSPADPSP